MATEMKCPVTEGAGKRPLARRNADWWPEQLNLSMLVSNSSCADPMDQDFDYAEEFKTLDLDAVVDDLHALMTDSQAWGPAD